MTTSDTFTPPYNLTWRAFLSSLDRMAADEALPSVIDRSYLNWMPGNVQTNYLSLCRQFGLIDAENAPTKLMHEIVYQPDTRPSIIERLLREHYAPIFELSLNATAQQLLDLWRETYGQSGETRRKAIAFFMHAANFAGIRISRNWERDVAKVSRQGSSSRRTRPRTTRVPKQAIPAQSTSHPSDTVVLDNGAGRLSISIEIDPLKLSEEDRQFVFGIIDSVRKYQEDHATNQDPDTANEPDTTAT